MAFWNMAFMYKWVSFEQLKLVVITEANPFGEITPEEFEKITGKKF